MENLLNHQWFACGFNNYHQIDDACPPFHDTTSSSNSSHHSFRKLFFEPFSHSSHSNDFDSNTQNSQCNNCTTSRLNPASTRQDRIQLFYGEFIENVCGGSFHTVIKTNFHRVFILGAPCNDFSEQDFAILEEEEEDLNVTHWKRALFENSKIGDVSNASLSQNSDETHSDNDTQSSPTLVANLDRARDAESNPFSSAQPSIHKKRTFCEISKHPLLRHSTISHIACGREHTILVTCCGNVFSLGSNSHGQCGVKGMKTLRGETSIFSLRVKQLTRVDFSHLCSNDTNKNTSQHGNPYSVTNHHSKISMIGCGQRFTILVKDNGLDMIVFGDNAYGQLFLPISNSTSSSSSERSQSNNIFVPQFVNFQQLQQSIHPSCNHDDSIIEASEKITQLAVGGFHTLLLTSHHNIYVSGRNYEGQLGLGSNFTMNSSIANYENSANSENSSNDSMTMTNFQKLTFFDERNIRIESISCGEKHSVFLTRHGTVYACGSNYKGQTGIHYNSLASTECLLRVMTCSPKLLNGSSSSTSLHSTTTTNSSLMKNQYHQYIHEPQLLLYFVEKRMRVKSVSCGAFHTWFHAENGENYVCGSNEEGQLGNGSQAHRCELIPVKFHVNRVQCKNDQYLKRRMSLMMMNEDGNGDEEHQDAISSGNSSEDEEIHTARMMNELNWRNHH
ncbi:hypothetical protein C9374_007564 [Naegleria lovaniensis]|uniref:Uncharacterized protein n=1 Tax=Naegleria lovaniensis TaxID=51637 RepID=A0AA88KI64_NAELO|nr:uncharacterized protein C9374_007564 [Naegleria lovaniensis]KAG2378926.1 hypothetical protein C9374_007564 [Naegleria lovaniensis]